MLLVACYAKYLHESRLAKIDDFPPTAAPTPADVPTFTIKHLHGVMLTNGWFRGDKHILQAAGYQLLVSWIQYTLTIIVL